MLTLLQIPGLSFPPKMIVSVWGGLWGQPLRDKALHSPTLTASSSGILVPKSTTSSQLFQLVWAQEVCRHTAALWFGDFAIKTEFLFIFICCHFLGVFPRPWEFCRRMGVSPGSTHVHTSAKSCCSGNVIKNSWSWHWKCGILAVLQVLSQMWWQEFSW